MKFSEFLSKVTPSTVGAFYQVRTEIDPHDIRDEDVLISNMELRFIDPPPEQSTDYINTRDFLEPPGSITEVVRVYNSPSEPISIVAQRSGPLEDGGLVQHQGLLLESDPLRGLTDEPIIFFEDPNSSIFSSVHIRKSTTKFRIMGVILIIILLCIIALTTVAILIISSGQVSLNSNSTLNVISITHLHDKGQLDFQALLNRPWPLLDITDCITDPSKEKTMELPLDAVWKYYSTESPKDPLKVIKSKVTQQTTPKSSYHPQVPVPTLEQKHVDEKIIQDSIVNAKKAIKFRSDSNNQSQEVELHPDLNSPVTYHYYFNRISKENQVLAEKGFAMQEMYRNVVERLSLTNEETKEGNVLLTATVPQEWCSASKVSERICNASDIYRTLDGSCNNMKEELWGSANLPYRRILFPDYEDGVSLPRILSSNGYPLPSAMEIRNKVHIDEYREDYHASSMFPIWAQFVYHDLVFTPISSGQDGRRIACCKDGEKIHPPNPSCFSISISREDLLYKTHNQTCMSFVRSAPNQNCRLGPREQFNQATSYLDASSIYGTTLKKSMSLRTGKHGQLRVYKVKDHGVRLLLPIITDINDTCNQKNRNMNSNYCFDAGDLRINEVATLTSLHTLWVRHHNHISTNLITQNRHWKDEEVFEEARRIVIAQIQHITYNEFLPELLGPELVAKTELKLLSKGYYEEYDINLNPIISNAFGIVFRFFHSMVQGLVKMVDTRMQNEDYIQQQNLVVNSSFLWKAGNMDAILNGATSQAASKVDIYVSNQLTRHLFQNQMSTFGLDLAAMDIQRGRDHGLPSYLEWRNTCGLSHVNKFHDLHAIWHKDAIQRVQTVYKSVKDVDLYTGMLAEKHIPGGRVGPTIACIVADQFLRLRKADRFWYEGDIEMKHFSSEQLESIRSTSLARIICDNSDGIRELQVWPMIRPSPSNPIVSCTDLPHVNFGPWKDKKGENHLADSLEDSVESTRTFNGKDSILGRSKGQQLIKFGTVAESEGIKPIMSNGDKTINNFESVVNHAN